MKKTDLYVLTGFLGAGKTSLLMHLLDHIEGKKIGIIQNEFGKLNIDGEILRRDGIEMTEISRGSIFCSCLKGAFTEALAEMGQRGLDCVFVESSGLADPSNIEEILAEVALKAGDVYEFRGAICLIDAVNFPEQVKDTATVDRQLAHCHMAAVNKTDLVEEGQLAAVIDLVRSVNPICKIETCVNGCVPLDFLQEDLMQLQWAECEASLNSPENKPKSIFLECTEPVEAKALHAFLQAVLPDCYRIKGFFETEAGWLQVDVVERLIDYRQCEKKGISQLVFLSKIGPQVIRSIDSAWKANVPQPMKMKN